MSLITVLRPATVEDCEYIYHAHLYAVQYTCRRSYDEQVLAVWSELLSPDSYIETINSPDYIVWVAEYKGNIQGFFQLNLQEAQLDALYVHPFVHNHGLGTALLQRAEELALQKGIDFIKLYASTNSIGFYKLNGYESLGAAVLPLSRKVAVNCELMRKHL